MVFLPMENTRRSIPALVAAVAAVAVVSATGSANALMGSISARHLNAISKLNIQSGTDPILQGSNSHSVAKGSTLYISAMTNSWAIPSISCTSVQVSHADGNIYDPGNGGHMLQRGMDVALVFFNVSNQVIGGFMLNATSVNGPLYTAGYSVATSQPLTIDLSDPALAGAKSAAFLIEGDVTNLDPSYAHTASSTVDGIIQCAS
jgi:hypothetical protein